jgi:hypothetical protein
MLTSVGLFSLCTDVQPGWLIRMPMVALWQMVWDWAKRYDTDGLSDIVLQLTILASMYRLDVDIDQASPGSRQNDNSKVRHRLSVKFSWQLGE